MNQTAPAPDSLLDQIPMQLIVGELESATHRLTSENVSLRARHKYLEDVVRGLQEHNVDLQNQLAAYEARDASPPHREGAGAGVV